MRPPSTFLSLFILLFRAQRNSYFAEVRQLEPQRTELMEIYSTVLWHLHAEVQLSTLAQDLVAQDRNSAAAWCSTGNLFSAQTEHETAIKFFQRAIQVRIIRMRIIVISKLITAKLTRDNLV